MQVELEDPRRQPQLGALLVTPTFEIRMYSPWRSRALRLLMYSIDRSFPPVLGNLAWRLSSTELKSR